MNFPFKNNNVVLTSQRASLRCRLPRIHEGVGAVLRQPHPGPGVGVVIEDLDKALDFRRGVQKCPHQLCALGPAEYKSAPVLAERRRHRAIGTSLAENVGSGEGHHRATTVVNPFQSGSKPRFGEDDPVVRMVLAGGDRTQLTDKIATRDLVKSDSKRHRRTPQ
jgi:hypothetical protein